jgi:hypothetical protein
MSAGRRKDSGRGLRRDDERVPAYAGMTTGPAYAGMTTGPACAGMTTGPGLRRDDDGKDLPYPSPCRGRIVLAKMLALLFFAALAITSLLQALIRRGSVAADSSPASLRLAARGLVTVGALVTLAPLLALAVDVTAIRSPREFLTFALFALICLALVLPVWIWLFAAWRKTATRSADAFVASAAAGNITISIVLYQGFFSGNADAQDGIVVVIVPLMQMLLTAAAAAVRRVFDQSWRKERI